MMELNLHRPITLIQGEDREVGVTVLYDSQEFKPYDLTGVTEIVATFIKRDNSTFVKKLSITGEVVVVDEECGKFTITLTAADTENMKASDKQSFEVAITDAGSKVRKFQVIGRLNVKMRLEC